MYLADFPADSLWEVYGSTELGIDCVLQPPDQLRKPGSCGQPAPMVEIRLFDENGDEVTGVGPDHPGELFVRGASVFADYYKQHDRFLADQREAGRRSATSPTATTRATTTSATARRT
jgi:fatty-acyl-CoA synthase/long-chain acyl-CoA synthetase